MSGDCTHGNADLVTDRKGRTHCRLCKQEKNAYKRRRQSNGY